MSPSGLCEAREARLRWFRRVLKRNSEDLDRRTLRLEVAGQRIDGQDKDTKFLDVGDRRA